MCSDGGESWSEEAIDFFEEVTHCAEWQLMHASTVDVKFSLRTVKLVDTSEAQVRVTVTSSSRCEQ